MAGTFVDGYGEAGATVDGYVAGYTVDESLGTICCGPALAESDWADAGASSPRTPPFVNNATIASANKKRWEGIGKSSDPTCSQTKGSVV